MKSKGLIIFGNTGTAVELQEFVNSYFSSLFIFVKIVFIEPDLIEKNNLLNLIEKDDLDINYIFGLTDINLRENCLNQIKGYESLKPYSFIHPSATIASSAKIGQGVYIGANVVVSSQAILADHVHVNINATVGHHAHLMDHVVVLPGARISGNVKVGKYSLIGSNAVLFQGISIGEYNAVDALTYVKKDLGPMLISFGAKCKSIKRVN